MKQYFKCVDLDDRYALTTEQMREVDRVATEEFGITVLQLMEMAAFQMARLIRSEYGELDGKNVLVFAGKGNNGGDAITCARYLLNYGSLPVIVCPKTLNKNDVHHLLLLHKLGVSIFHELESSFSPDLIVDGILGYSIKGSVRSPYSDWIGYINSSSVPVFSVDIPSGLDPDNGSVHDACVKATHTLTLAYPKKGLLVKKAKPYVGELFLADIGIPAAVYETAWKQFPKMKYKNLFKKSSLVKFR